MPGLKQSALLLHGLSKPDRNWILERLASHDQDILQQHLAELRSLGIPADPTLGRGRQIAAESAVPATLTTASLEQMQHLLKDEPVWLISHLLGLGDWPWRADFIAALPPSQRERVSARRGAPLAEPVAQHLLAHVAQQLQRSDAAPPGPATGTASTGFLGTLRSMLQRWR